MFGKIKNTLASIKEENQRKREEQEHIARERAEEEARLKRERIQAEKDALMALSEKELMVEAIMALRGYNTRIKLIEGKQDILDDRVSSIESSVSLLRTDVIGLQNNTTS